MAAWRKGLGHDREDRPDGGHGLSGLDATPRRDDVAAALRLHVRAAVPVLLDDGDQLQAGHRALRFPPLQPALGGASDAAAYSKAAVRDRLPVLDHEHD